MRQLPNNINLDKKYQRFLSSWETEIQAITPYSRRIKVAKDKWRSRRQSKTLQHVCLKLEEMCTGNRRCCYCEDSVADEVEHIKPKSIYPELTFSWDNYLYACGPCNGRKNNKYALFIGGVFTPLQPSHSPPSPGDNVFINPRQDNPMDFLDLDLGTQIEDGTLEYLPKYSLPQGSIDYQRAEYTIRTLGLNRDVLVAGRKNAALDFKARLYQYEQKKNSFTTQELRQFQANFQVHPYPSVWQHIKVQHQYLLEINSFFQRFPEIQNW